MAWLLDWIPTLILAVWFGIGVARDSRRFGLGILLVLTVGSAIVTGLAQLGEALSDGSEAETMAVAIILSPTARYTWEIISSSNPGTIAGDIALQFPESSGLDVNTLVASGLVLFALTLAVNMLARWIVSRRAEFSGAN